ncbi:MAG: MarR family transcriptional regulator, organic hydroperoxide resistance regulator [Patescibacteria group bacterium]|nr:MarR family transcriptional regulator, organic hydroperoxide resistance regulator [Patescibacteria group bacterium]
MEKRNQILEKIMKQLGGLHRHIATSRDTFLSQFELSRPQVDLLYCLHAGKKTTSELAKIFGVSSSAVSQMTDQLQLRKLVERVPDASDKRVSYIQLSHHGTTTFCTIREKFMEHISTKFKGVTIEELQTLLTIITNVENEITKGERT